MSVGTSTCVPPMSVTLCVPAVVAAAVVALAWVPCWPQPARPIAARPPARPAPFRKSRLLSVLIFLVFLMRNPFP